MLTLFRILRFVSIFLSWLFFFVFIKDQSRWALYAIPITLFIGVATGPVEKYLEVKNDSKKESN